MKRLTLPLLLVMSPAAIANWSLQHFPAFTEQDNGIFVSTSTLTKGEHSLTFYQDKQCWQPTMAVKLNQTFSLQPCQEQTAISWRLFRDGQYQARIDTRSGTPTLTLSIIEPVAETVSVVTHSCQRWDGKAVTVDVSQTFAEDENVRDFYSGQTAKVSLGVLRRNPRNFRH